MNLIKSPQWTAEIPTAPPRYDYSGLTLPPEVNVTHINIMHSTDGNGAPDYLEGTLKDADVFMPEQPGWTPELEKIFNRSANGDFKARQKTLTMTSSDPHQQEYMRFALSQLYNSKVVVPMVDYPRGQDYSRWMHASRTAERPENMMNFNREQFVLNSICSSINKLRKEHPRFKSRPINAVVWYGAQHMGLADGIREVAAHSDADISVAEQYEAVYADDNIKRSSDRPDTHIIAYQTWLRTGA